MPKANILVVDDEKEIAELIEIYLNGEGYQVYCAYNAADGLKLLERFTIHLAILDIMMPRLDGFTVCKFARNICDVPIIFLTAKGEENDKLKGYEYGADDYVTKPFSPKILLAKVNAWLRHATATNSQDILSAGEIMLYPSAHTVIVSGNEVELTHKEYELLHLFLQNKNQVFSREQLLNRIWGFDFEGNTRTVDSHIKTLRQKLGTEGRHIVTLIRSGYKFEVKP